jgi:hypothetical protein
LHVQQRGLLTKVSLNHGKRCASVTDVVAQHARVTPQASPIGSRERPVSELGQPGVERGGT